MTLKLLKIVAKITINLFYSLIALQAITILIEKLHNQLGQLYFKYSMAVQSFQIHYDQHPILRKTCFIYIILHPDRWHCLWNFCCQFKKKSNIVGSNIYLSVLFKVN